MATAKFDASQSTLNLEGVLVDPKGKPSSTGATIVHTYETVNFLFGEQVAKVAITITTPNPDAPAKPKK